MTARPLRAYIRGMKYIENSQPAVRCRQRIVRAAAGCLLAAVFAFPALAQRAVILVRHAEKADASKDPVLSEAGTARASALVKMLAGAGISAIYCSEYQRTKLTAEPLAAALKIPIRMFPASNPAALIEEIRTANANETVLVVGHSNTLPDLMKRLGHPAEENIADDDYGNIFVLVPKDGERPIVIRLRY